MRKITTVGIASVASRREQLLTVIRSLAGQTDRIVVALNNYPEIPQELSEFPNVECYLTDNRLADGYKFLGVDSADGIYLSCDDDLLYPVGYVKKCVDAIEKYHCIITYHGKCYDRRPIASYHRSFTTNIRCLGSLARDTVVHVGGSGVMAWDTKDFKFSLSDVGSPFMADIWVSKKAHEQGVRIMALAHPNNYFQYLGTPDTPIWGRRKGNQEETVLVRSFLR